nr:4Fe-4S binding protein [Lachnospiraceae bacterium]
NSTTAMTGHQPHPGTGRNMMGNVVDKISIEAILKGIGLKKVVTIDPLDLETAVKSVRECSDIKGVKAIIFKSPCIAIARSDKKCEVTDKCIGCKKCIREIGCPALVTDTDTSGGPVRVTIDTAMCTGCMLCSRVCPAGAVKEVCNG